MRFFDKLFLGILLGLVSPLVLFLVSWWISAFTLPENYVSICSLTGFVLGCIIDALFLKNWIRKGFEINKFIQAGIYLFYSFCAFGLFMAVPIFNIFMGVIAGTYVARKILHDKIAFDVGKKQINRAGIFTTIVIIFICIASAYIAINDPYTGGNLKAMLNLSFEVTEEMIYGIIVVGGLALVVLQYWITKITSLVTLSLSRKNLIEEKHDKI